ncbi:MAG: FtsL-like putative cell division protein [Saprospiraceae bacterium]
MANRLLNALNISHHSTEWVFGNFSYLLFLSFLALVYIANAHYAEKNVREIQRLQKEIKELKWQYTSIKSETMFKSMQSQMDANLQPTGVHLSNKGPKVIEIK